MSERTGKCTNYASCATAYRNEPVTVSGDLVCPECGRPLQPIGTAAASSGKPLLIGGVAAALLLVGGIVFFVSRETTPPPRPAEPPVSSPTPPLNPIAPLALPPQETPLPPPVAATPAPEVSPETIEPGATPIDSEPARDVRVEPNVNVDLVSAENQRVRQEVLSRIDAMPNLSEANKAKLYDHVNRARGMGKIITIPFGTGATTMTAREINQLAAAVRSPQVATLLEDPTSVFVILGFADKRGDESVNLRVSLARAENVMETLRDKCGLQNVMQPVGMGGSAMFDAGDHAKNRVAEVWAVLP